MSNLREWLSRNLQSAEDAGPPWKLVSADRTHRVHRLELAGGGTLVRFERRGEPPTFATLPPGQTLPEAR